MAPVLVWSSVRFLLVWVPPVGLGREVPSAAITAKALQFVTRIHLDPVCWGDTNKARQVRVVYIVLSMKSEDLDETGSGYQHQAMVP